MESDAAQDAGQHLILYDGVCGLCNRMNSFVLRRDPTGIFHFAPLQSQLSRSLLTRLGRNPDAFETFYVVADYRSDNPRLLLKAQAALFVARQIGAIWGLAVILKALPVSLLNFVYDGIARHRYRIFGRYDACLMPKPEYRARFIDL